MLPCCGGEFAGFVDDGDEGEVVAFANFKIGVVVGGGKFDDAGAEGFFDEIVGDDGDFAGGEGELDMFVDDVLVTGVVWVDGEGGVTEHGFGAGGRNDDFAVAVGEGVGDVVESTLLFVVGDFDVGEGGLVLDAEVDGFFAAVDEAVVPHFFEGGVGGVDDVRVESEGEGGPIEGGAEGAELELHVAALFLYKVPGHLVEFFPAVVEAAVALAFELFFEDDPGFEAGVVGAGDVPGGVALLSVIADEDVFYGDGEAVADVEVAVGVGRW